MEEDAAYSILENIRIVLVHTSHPGNIGGVARAMKTMGLRKLALVAPLKFPHADAFALAAGACDVLEHAHVCATLEEAVAGCGLVLAASARERTIAWPQHDARNAAQHAVANAQHMPVAIVFGPEREGLTNAQIDLCHALVKIPANPQYSSLNLAAATQVISYELRVAAMHLSTASRNTDVIHVPAPHAELERFYAHLHDTLIKIGFLDPNNPRQLMRRIRRLFNRAQPDTIEINILRGILTATDAKCGNKFP